MPTQKGESCFLREGGRREHSWQAGLPCRGPGARGSTGHLGAREGRRHRRARTHVRGRPQEQEGKWKHRGPKSLPSRGGACGVWDAVTTPQGYDVFITESVPVTAGHAGFQTRKRRKSCTTEPSLLLSFTAEENRGLSWKQQSAGPSSGSSQVAASGALWEDREETHHPKPTISFQRAKPIHV